MFSVLFFDVSEITSITSDLCIFNLGIVNTRFHRLNVGLDWLCLFLSAAHSTLHDCGECRKVGVKSRKE